MFADLCVCTEVFAEVCIQFCTNAANYPGGRQMAERIESVRCLSERVSLREESSLCSHTCMSVYVPSSPFS